MNLENMTLMYIRINSAYDLSHRRAHSATSPTHVLGGLADFIPVVSSLSTVLKKCVTSRVLYSLNRAKDQYVKEEGEEKP
jgi:hypothetical protein